MNSFSARQGAGVLLAIHCKEKLHKEASSICRAKWATNPAIYQVEKVNVFLRLPEILCRSLQHVRPWLLCQPANLVPWGVQNNYIQYWLRRPLLPNMFLISTCSSQFPTACPNCPQWPLARLRRVEAPENCIIGWFPIIPARDPKQCGGEQKDNVLLMLMVMLINADDDGN